MAMARRLALTVAYRLNAKLFCPTLKQAVACWSLVLQKQCLRCWLFLTGMASMTLPLWGILVKRKIHA
jgi:hypothetical protein